MDMRTPLVLLAAVAFAVPAVAGPYTIPGIPASSPRFVGWATGATVVRGPQDISAANSPLASFGTAAAALGAANNGPVSLGDGGFATLTFARPIGNGAGADFAVFENGFGSGGGVSAELGHVEVSSNGVDFFRFPSVSLTQTATPVGGFGVIDPTNISNLAGKDVANVGTGFDLAELAGLSPLLDINRVTHVRVVDVVGSLNPAFGTRDSLGNLINDPFPTPFASSGFDLDAVGVINQAVVPEPATAALFALGAAALGFRRRRPAAD